MPPNPSMPSGKENRSKPRISEIEKTAATSPLLPSPATNAVVETKRRTRDSCSDGLSPAKKKAKVLNAESDEENSGECLPKRIKKPSSLKLGLKAPYAYLDLEEDGILVAFNDDSVNDVDEDIDLKDCSDSEDDGEGDSKDGRDDNDRGNRCSESKRRDLGPGTQNQGTYDKVTIDNSNCRNDAEPPEESVSKSDGLPKCAHRQDSSSSSGPYADDCSYLRRESWMYHKMLGAFICTDHGEAIAEQNIDSHMLNHKRAKRRKNNEQSKFKAHIIAAYHPVKRLETSSVITLDGPIPYLPMPIPRFKCPACDKASSFYSGENNVKGFKTHWGMAHVGQDVPKPIPVLAQLLRPGAYAVVANSYVSNSEAFLRTAPPKPDNIPIPKDPFGNIPGSEMSSHNWLLEVPFLPWLLKQTGKNLEPPESRRKLTELFRFAQLSKQNMPPIEDPENSRRYQSLLVEHSLYLMEGYLATYIQETFPMLEESYGGNIIQYVTPSSKSTFRPLVESTSKSYAKMTMGILLVLLRYKMHLAHGTEPPCKVPILTTFNAELETLYKYISDGAYLKDADGQANLKLYTHSLLFKLVTGGVYEADQVGCPTDVSLILTSLDLKTDTMFRSPSDVGKLCAAYQYAMRCAVVREFLIRHPKRPLEDGPMDPTNHAYEFFKKHEKHLVPPKSTKGQGGVQESTAFGRLKYYWFTLGEYAYNQLGKARVQILKDQIILSRGIPIIKAFAPKAFFDAPRALNSKARQLLDDMLPDDYKFSQIISELSPMDIVDNFNDHYHSFIDNNPKLDAMRQTIWSLLMTPGERHGLVHPIDSASLNVSKCEEYLIAANETLENILVLFLLTSGLTPRPLTTSSYTFKGRASSEIGVPSKHRCLYKLPMAFVLQGGKVKNPKIQGHNWDVQHAVYDDLGLMLTIYLSVIRAVVIGIQRTRNEKWDNLSLYIFVDAGSDQVWDSETITKTLKRFTKGLLKVELTTSDLRQIMTALYRKYFKFIMTSNNDDAERISTIGDGQAMHDPKTGNNNYGKGMTAQGMDDDISDNYILASQVYQAGVGVIPLKGHWPRKVLEAVIDIGNVTEFWVFYLDPKRMRAWDYSRRLVQQMFSKNDIDQAKQVLRNLEFLRDMPSGTFNGSRLLWEIVMSIVGDTLLYGDGGYPLECVVEAAALIALALDELVSDQGTIVFFDLNATEVMERFKSLKTGLLLLITSLKKANPEAWRDFPKKWSGRQTAVKYNFTAINWQ